MSNNYLQFHDKILPGSEMNVIIYDDLIVHQRKYFVQE